MYISGDRLRILRGEMLRAAIDHFGHGPHRHRARRDAGGEERGDVRRLPAGDRRRVPVLHRDEAAAEVELVAYRAEDVAAGVARVAVTQAAHEIGAAVPLRALVVLRPVHTRTEIQGPP